MRCDRASPAEFGWRWTEWSFAARPTRIDRVVESSFLRERLGRQGKAESLRLDPDES